MPNINYEMTPPCLISVSGGRTSGFMLRQILDAHGGTLPADVHAVFCNTGLEHEQTLRFLHEIETRWCPITWLEYRYRQDADRKHDFEVVNYCSASRRGEPFKQLIDHRSMLPNPVMRFCTGELKIRTANRWAKQALGFEDFTRAVGLRWDEPRRVQKLKADNPNEIPICPISDAKHTLADVTAFWKAQDFDLELPGDDPAFGNCVLCFLKKRAKIAKVMRTSPTTADWYIEQEERTDLARDGLAHQFRADRPTYRQMRNQLNEQGQMFDDAIEDDSLPCACTD